MNSIFMVVGLGLNIFASIFLFFGSKGIDWNKQTWDGKSKEEIKFNKRQKCSAKTGFILLFFGFLLQLISIFV